MRLNQIVNEAIANAAPSLTCPHCSSVLRPVNPIPAGKNVRCPKCAEIFTAANGFLVDFAGPGKAGEDKSRDEAFEADMQRSVSGDGDGQVITCPHCSGIMRPDKPIPPETKVQCGGCNMFFYVPKKAESDLKFTASDARRQAKPGSRPIVPAHFLGTLTMTADGQELTCPHCNASHQLGITLVAGAQLKCPECSKPFIVPNKAGPHSGPSALKGGQPAGAAVKPKKTPATNGKLTRAQADKFLDFMPDKLAVKCAETLSRLKSKSTPEYYNRANVQLREYVHQIRKIWTDYFNGIVSEAQVHSLGTIYNALLDYSRKLYTDYVKGLGTSLYRVDGGDGTLDSPQPAEAEPMNKKNFNYHKSTYGGTGNKVTTGGWLKNFLTKKNAVPWLKGHGLADRVSYFMPYLRLRGDDQSLLSPDDKINLKSLVSDIYEKLAAQRGIT